jgi:hypothetical protein
MILKMDALFRDLAQLREREDLEATAARRVLLPRAFPPFLILKLCVCWRACRLVRLSWRTLVGFVFPIS